MNIKRRDFCMGLAGGGLGLLGLPLAPAALAQDGPVEGTHYVRLSQPAPTSAAGKIEVVEFFWYGCPHCNAFEPTLDAWSRKLPADVAFRRLPVALRDEWATHQRIFFALDAMGLVDTMHRKVFYAIHNDRMRLDTPAEISAFMVKNGVDGAKFLDNFNSFSAQTKARQANQLAAGYKIDGVPALGVQGRFYTAVSLAGSSERALSVADFLINRIRKSG
jgi:protein dithiol oxidoreductase (disulfide-forming)